MLLNIPIMHSQPPTHTHNKGLWELKCQWLVRLKNFAPGWSWASPNPSEDILAIEPIYIKRYWKAEYRQKLLLMFLFEITGLLNLKSTSWESYIYIYIYICVCVCVCVYTHTHIYICICIHTYIHKYISRWFDGWTDRKICEKQKE